MTLTNKDKMMLVVLAIVIFVAVFYMYGIVPANDALDASEATIKTKQSEVDALNDRLMAVNMNSINKKYDELLEYYYANNNSVLDDPMENTDIDEKMFTLFEECGLSGYSSSGWYPVQKVNMSTMWDGQAVVYSVNYIDCTTSFKADDPNAVNTFIDRVRADYSMELTRLTFTITETTESVDDDGNPDTPEIEVAVTTYSGSFTLRFTMQVDIDTANIPALLPNTDRIQVSPNNGLTISFAAVENAVSYEFYTFTEGVDGNRYYSEKPIATFKPGTNTGALEYTLSASAATGTQNIVVRAIGDKSAGYFKSPLNNTVPYVTVTFG